MDQLSPTLLGVVKLLQRRPARCLHILDKLCQFASKTGTLRKALSTLLKQLHDAGGLPLVDQSTKASFLRINLIRQSQSALHKNVLRSTSVRLHPVSPSSVAASSKSTGADGLVVCLEAVVVISLEMKPDSFDFELAGNHRCWSPVLGALRVSSVQMRAHTLVYWHVEAQKLRLVFGRSRHERPEVDAEVSLSLLPCRCQPPTDFQREAIPRLVAWLLGTFDERSPLEIDLRDVEESDEAATAAPTVAAPTPASRPPSEVAATALQAKARGFLARRQGSRQEAEAEAEGGAEGGDARRPDAVPPTPATPGGEKGGVDQEAAAEEELTRLLLQAQREARQPALRSLEALTQSHVTRERWHERRRDREEQRREVGRVQRAGAKLATLESLSRQHRTAYYAAHEPTPTVPSSRRSYDASSFSSTPPDPALEVVTAATEVQAKTRGLLARQRSRVLKLERSRDAMLARDPPQGGGAAAAGDAAAEDAAAADAAGGEEAGGEAAAGGEPAAPEADGGPIPSAAVATSTASTAAPSSETEQAAAVHVGAAGRGYLVRQRSRKAQWQGESTRHRTASAAIPRDRGLSTSRQTFTIAPVDRARP